MACNAPVKLEADDGTCEMGSRPSAMGQYHQWHLPVQLEAAVVVVAAAVGHHSMTWAVAVAVVVVQQM
jgi:hypothetical protein